MSSAKIGVATIGNFTSAAQAAAVKAAAAETAKPASYHAKMAGSAHMAAGNAAGVVGAGAVVGAQAEAHTGLSMAGAVLTPVAAGAVALLVTYGAARLAVPRWIS
jgi:hypothetical protein